MLHLPVRSIGDTYSVELQRSPMGLLQRSLKRAMDLAIAVPLAILLLPALLVVGLAIKFDSRGPVLFRQNRLGYRGRPFQILKFRTMMTLDDGEVVRCAEIGDRRVTRIGGFLRKMSIDELPQLLNVIRGEMSLIGPRPHALAHDREFSEKIAHYEVRQHVKPGITGWAQVNGLRGGGDHIPGWIDKRVEHDIWYAKNANIWLDMKIFARTFFEVFRQTNAY
jgi:exopolysaccharide biosynthesis polyprenyl glycosylphosphotransferase